MARSAEELLPQIEAFFQVHLDFQPAIVLTEYSDVPEGYTDPLMGVIHLSVAKPYEILSNGTGFQEWLHMVLAHEITHLVHLEAVGRNLEWLWSLLGYVVLPNVIQPLWVWEGYALYGEGMLTVRGVQNPFYAMVLRTQALSGTVLPPHLLRGHSFPKNWPGRLNVSIYGVSMIEYIAQTFGEEKLVELSRRRSESASPFGFDRKIHWGFRSMNYGVDGKSWYKIKCTKICNGLRCLVFLQLQNVPLKATLQVEWPFILMGYILFIPFPIRISDRACG
ncbi:MAG: hypothetical protein ABDK92_01160 [Atribacterota bacterium]